MEHVPKSGVSLDVIWRDLHSEGFGTNEIRKGKHNEEKLIAVLLIYLSIPKLKST